MDLICSCHSINQACGAFPCLEAHPVCYPTKHWADRSHPTGPKSLSLLLVMVRRCGSWAPTERTRLRSPQTKVHGLGRRPGRPTVNAWLTFELRKLTRLANLPWRRTSCTRKISEPSSLTIVWALLCAGCQAAALF